MRTLSVLVLLAGPICHLMAAEPTVRPALIYSKSFGGSGSDYGVSVATDSSGNVYISGNTDSADFPVKNGFQPRMGGAALRASLDSGNTWSAIAIPKPVYTVAGSAKAPGVLYAGTSSTIYKSTDSGKTWNVLSEAPKALVNALIVDSADPSVVYAGTNWGLFKSQDAGMTWARSDPPIEADQLYWNVIDLVANPARPSTLFAGISSRPHTDQSGNVILQASVYRSTDAGATWTPLPSLPDPVVALVSDPSSPDTLYATVNPLGFGFLYDSSRTSIFKSTDAGNTWTKLTEAPAANSTASLAASPTFVYAATDNGVIRSRDGGVTWAATTVTAAADNVAVDPNNPQIVYASAGGIAVSADGGTTWKITLPVRQNVQTISLVPGTPGLVFVGATPGQNVFVTKWSGDGAQMIYSTYLGGSYFDNAVGIAVDRQGNAYVTGYTYATDFPVTRGALQTKTTAPYAAFLAKISPDGSTLLYSTYLSGSSGDAAFAIAVDGSGNAYLTGYAGSADFPVTPGAFQSATHDKCTSQTADSPVGDAFVSKVSSDGSSLLYSTRIGGRCGDEGSGITVDNAGSATIVGLTESDDFPVTKGSFLEKWPGVESGFVARLSPQGTALLQASFIGGTYNTTADAVAMDGKGNMYITGCSEGFDDVFRGSGPFLAQAGGGPGLPQAGFFGTCTGVAYVLKLDPAVSFKVYLSYLGGPVGDGGNVAVDPAGKVWIAGYEYPVTAEDFPYVHPFQTRMGQGFVSEWSADGATLLFSSRLDWANGMALDGSGNVFLSGFTTGFTTDKLYQPYAVVTRIDGAVPSAVTVEDPQRITPGPADLMWSDQPIASGEILVIPGSGMGPVQKVGAQLGPDGRLATTLAGTSVTFGDVPAPLLSVQSDQIVCIVPFEIGGPMQVQSNGALSNSILMPSEGAAVEAFAIANADGSVNTADHPAPSGSIITVYAAGFGPTVPDSLDGEINGTTPRSLLFGKVGVTIFDDNFNSWPAEVLYGGSAPGQVAGITQINFRLPQLSAGQYTVAVGFAPIGQGPYDVIALNVGQP